MVHSMVGHETNKSSAHRLVFQDCAAITPGLPKQVYSDRICM